MNQVDIADDRAGPLWLALLCTNRFTASLAFMMYAGALPIVMSAWAMSASEAGAIQTAFNLSYALSLVATSWLADRRGAKRVFLTFSWLTAAFGIAFAVFARSYLSGLILFSVLGLVQGGTYGPSIMLIAQSVPGKKRGTAVGWLIAAASLGYFASIAIAGTLANIVSYELAFAICGASPVIGAIAAQIGLHRSPNFIAPRNEVRLAGISSLFTRRSFLLTAGYTAHCWELLGMWAWMPTFLAGALSAQGLGSVRGLIAAALIHLTGFVASVSSGIASDRLGRRTVLIAFATAGAACSFGIGWSLELQFPILLALAALYGFAVIGDSGVLSTAMTESVHPGQLGMALAVRSILGFGAGGLAPLAFGFVMDATGGATGWVWAFTLLGFGGILAVISALLLAPEASA